jgi:CheY-like chemotaxis protein
MQAYAMFLVIDDEANIREMMAELFALHGYSGRTAQNGRDALQTLRARAKLPRLILLDVAMPVLDGWGFLLERSKDSLIMAVPVIVVSASPGLERRAKAAGAQAVLRKPLELQDLLSAAEPFLNVA